MLIRKGEKKYSANIKEIWQASFTEPEDLADDPYFLENVYNPENALIAIENNKVVSSLQRYPHQVMVNGRVLQASMILGVCTLPDYRNKGYMKALMNTCVDEIEHQELLTYIQANDPSLYEPFGFTTVFKQNRYHLTRKDLDRISNDGLTYDIRIQDLLSVYAIFARHFNGYYVRDINYFEKKKKEIYDRKGKIVAYIDNKGIQGYAIMIPYSDRMVIEEAVYLNVKALAKFVNLALQQKPRVELRVSVAEQIKPLFPNADVEEVDFCMARINDYELFNRLFHSQVTTTEQAFELFKKPPYLNEYM